LYPSSIETEIPLHARGGVDGQQVFKEQLTTADYHLTNNGIIVFNQMCLGRDGKPAFVDYIPRIIDDCSLEYTNILPPIKTSEFLNEVYGPEFADYVSEVSRENPQLFYCNGIIKRDGNGRVGRILLNNILIKNGLPPVNIDLKNRFKYYGVLQAYQKEHNIRPTIEFLLEEYKNLKKALN
jgi:hypothetical protein